jgi:hypothetical protein
MNDSHLDDLLAAALARLEREMALAAPIMAERMSGWMRQLARSPRPEDYFNNSIGFPLLRLPWWLEATFHAPDPTFQADLVYSTVNGYYYIRLLDNVMDGHTTVERQLLPAAGFYHTQFQSAYQRYFEPRHPFWAFFEQTWFRSAEVTVLDASLDSLTLAQFQQIAGQKVCAAKIPLAAVCHRYERAGLLEPWSQFVDALGAWHQMWNDVFDWHKDLTYETRTYFLSEAGRRKRPDEPAAAWVVREGFDWGVATLQAWMQTLKEQARGLSSPGLLRYLEQRDTMLQEQKDALADHLSSLSRLAVAMG